jgi:hypothetical protein
MKIRKGLNMCIHCKCKRSIYKSALAGLGTALLLGALAGAAELAELPLYDEGRVRVAQDWLTQSVEQSSRAYRSPDGKSLVLANGLVARTFRISPNLATVSLKRLSDGMEYIRSVRPEAIVEFDGVKYPVGGLSGQPVHNYLDPAWLDRMESPVGAYRFAGFELGATEERFPWQKRLEWMPRDLPWPPPGLRLSLRFEPPLAPPDVESGELLLSSDFTAQLGSEWRIHATKTHARAAFSNEGKPGEIMAPPDSCVYAERKIPAAARSFELTLDSGNDTRANSWGPGLALLAGQRPLASLVVRPNSQQYEIVTATASEKLFGGFDRSKPVTLRIRLADGRAHFEAAQDGADFKLLTSLPIQDGVDTLRIGKVGKGGAGRDYSDAPFDPDALPPRQRLHALAVRAAPESAAAPRSDLPTVLVNYEIYDGIPVLSKWVSFENDTGSELRLNTFVSEIIAVVESESVVDGAAHWGQPELLVQTDYTFGGMSAAGTNQPAVEWGSDPLYSSQVHYRRQTPCLIQCRPPRGPDQIIADGEGFETFRTFVLAHGSTERERRGLEFRRMYRVLAPWVTENPVLMHVRSARPEAVRRAIDQCAEVGFEMVIMTFGSGFNFESRDPAYQKQIKELVDYGLEKGIVLGGYSLLASRNAGTPQENTQGSPAMYGRMPCLGAQWGVDYLAQLKHFMEYAGLAILEHDGSYPGDMCAATDHPYHRGLDDSQWVMWKAITDLYKWCRANGVYLNIPDWYFMNGASKTGMGYREVNWSLPREYQEVIERQNIYDGTREKTPSMGWMFVPLVNYHGGGPAATIEPLDQHRAHYGQRMANLFGAGVQACYRGPRLYDTEATKELVAGWVDFYKRHRALFDGDIIHLRRADGRDIDYLLNVDPGQRECGMLVVYNPLEVPVKRRLSVPLYYTGLKDGARVTSLARIAPAEVPPAAAVGPSRSVTLGRDYRAQIEIDVPARGTSFYLIERP